MSQKNSNNLDSKSAVIHHLSAQKFFRYSTLGDSKKAKILLYVLHGYGQLSPYFIRKFNFLSDNYFIVAHEGMHRFYLQGTSGRVGASWMTKEDREIDIADNINWLNELDRSINDLGKFERTVILGFSQGGATAARWYYSNKIKVNQLILWASVFPSDIDPPEISTINSTRNIFFVVGKEDEYYTIFEQQEIIKNYQDKGFRTLTFNGKHDIDRTTLESILSELNVFYT
jgi:predicted esterase